MTTPTLKTLVLFDNSNIANPDGGLITDAAGDLFGMADSGLSIDDGAVFEIANIGGTYANTPTTLASLSGYNGDNLVSGLTKDASGDLFGTTNFGGTNNDGYAFEVPYLHGTYASSPTILINFSTPSSGYGPAPLLVDNVGNLFGETFSGGTNNYGTVFELPYLNGGYANTATTVANFNLAPYGTSSPYNLGIGPAGGLTADAAGNLFGTTVSGGANGGGTVFEIPKIGNGYANSPTDLAEFANIPDSGVIINAAGDLFGTTDGGTVFEVVKTANGYVTNTQSGYPPDPILLATLEPGTDPLSGLLMDAAGDLFGTTEGGGTGYGSVFEIAFTGGAYASTPITVFNFTPSTGNYPDGALIADASGNLIGTTLLGPGGHQGGNGTVFELTGTGFQTGSTGIVPPTITGTTAGLTVTDVTTIAPFSKVAVADTNSGQADTVAVSLSVAANGTLSNLGDGTYNPTTGVYTDSGSPASITAALDGLIFNPTPHQAAASQTVTTSFTINVTDTAGQSANDSTTSVVTTESSLPSTGLLGILSVNQQLELIYTAYFNRAADSAGFTFWQQQIAQAENQGQSAAVALTNVANSFAPQPETEALYPSLDPYLGTPNPPGLNTGAGQAALNSFITGVYGNLFGHAPDPAGQTYWVGQLTSGAVGLGAAALAIANGATGADATSVMNKIAAAIATTSGASGTALAGSSSQAAGVTPLGSTDPTVISITQSNSVIDPGLGSYPIQFLGGASGDTLVLHTGDVDQISGFNPSSDALDLRALLSEANVNLNGNVAALGSYLTVTDQGANALLSFDPTGHGAGSPVAVLLGLGNTVTGLNTLVADGAIRIA